MSPLTHLLASWIVAARTTDNLRDRRLVTLAGVAPDLDGLGLIVDFFRERPRYYPEYHHWLAHGLPAALVCSALFAIIARRRWRVFGLCLLTFHLHLLCDLLGSRGPDVGDKWPIYYFGPLSQNPVWFWKYQWRLDGWQNQVITMVLLIWAIAWGLRMGDTFVGVINHRFDRVFVSVLRKWAGQALNILKPRAPDPKVGPP